LKRWDIKHKDDKIRDEYVFRIRKGVPRFMKLELMVVA
jgi:hypothetical protein